MSDMCYQVDVIVPVYNAEKYLEQCIKSVLAQSYTNVHLILVDDGSIDSSGCICDSWHKQDDRVSVIHKENGGLVSAWKRGLHESNADWVVFIDSDDWIEINHIRALVKNQVETNADVVVTRMRQVGKGIYEYIPFDVVAKCYKGDSLINELYPVMINAGGFEKRGVPFSRCSKLIKKSIMIDNLSYVYDKATYEEDFNIIAPVLMDAKAISLIEVEGAAYCYRRVEDSMLHGHDKNMSVSIDNVYKGVFRACEEKNATYLTKQIYSELLSAYVRLYLNEIKKENNIRQIDSLVNAQDMEKCLDNKKQWNKYPLKFKVVVLALKNRGNCIEKFIKSVLRTVYKYILWKGRK